MGQDKQYRSEKKEYKGRIDARGVPRTTKRVVGALGEPGRFVMLGRGMKQGVKHFST